MKISRPKSHRYDVNTDSIGYHHRIEPLEFVVVTILLEGSAVRQLEARSQQRREAGGAESGQPSHPSAVLRVGRRIGLQIRIMLQAGFWIRSDSDRIRILLSGQTESGSIIFFWTGSGYGSRKKKLYPDPDPSVMKIFHPFYDDFHLEDFVFFTF